MTVCIAALCNNAKSIIVVSDRMITATYPPVEFEHGIPKLEIICPSCVVLTAGDALAHADLCRNVREAISSISRPRTAQITEQVRRGYITQRLEAIEQLFFAPRGWALQDFYGRLIGALPTDLAVTIDNQIATYDYGLTIIIAGVDTDQAHIYGLRHPGMVDCYDSIGYHAIGIGSIHAISSLIANGYLPTTGVKMAIYLVYEAKRNAESAPGVGKDTDMAILRESECQNITPEQISALEQIYDSRRMRQTDEFRKAVDELPF